MCSRLPGGADSKVSAYNVGDPGSIPRSGRSPTPVFLSGKSHGWRSLVGYSPRGRKESDITERLHSVTRSVCSNWELVKSNRTNPPQPNIKGPLKMSKNTTNM